MWKNFLLALFVSPLIFAVFAEVALHGLFWSGHFPDFPVLMTRLEKRNYLPEAEFVYEDNVLHRTQGFIPYVNKGIPSQLIEFADDGMRIDGYHGDAKCVIAMFGDSYTEAREVGQLDNFSSLAELALRNSGYDVDFRVFGFGGQSPAAGYIRYRQLVDAGYNFTHVIQQFTPGNDVEDSHIALNRYVAPSLNYPYFVLDDGQLVRDDKVVTAIERSRFRKFVGDYSHLANFAQTIQRYFKSDFWSRRQFEVFDTSPVGDWAEAWQVTEAVTRRWARDVEEKGANFMMLMVTAEVQFINEMASIPGYDRRYPGQRMGKLARGLDVGFLDILPAGLEYVERTNLQFPHFSWLHDGHYSPLGHQLVADNLTPYLADRMTECRN